MNRGIMVTRDDPGKQELVLSAKYAVYLLYLTSYLCTYVSIHPEVFAHQLAVMKYVKDWNVSLIHLLKCIMKYVKNK